MAAGINRIELQRKLISDINPSFQNSTQEPAVLLHQSCTKPTDPRISHMFQKGIRNTNPAVREEDTIPDRNVNFVRPLDKSARKTGTSRKFAKVKRSCLPYRRKGAL